MIPIGTSMKSDAMVMAISHLNANPTISPNGASGSTEGATAGGVRAGMPAARLLRRMMSENDSRWSICDDTLCSFRAHRVAR